jgi:uncharacterized protein
MMSSAEPEPTAILTADMKRVVAEQRLGFVATVCSDGTPNLSPKGTTRIWGDDHLVFCDLMSPQTIENLRTNSAVEVNVVDPIARRGYRFKGSADVLADGALFEEILAFYQNGKPPMADARERIRHIVLVKIDRALPLFSPAYALGQSEDAIRAAWWDHFNALQTEYAAGNVDGQSPKPAPADQ